MGIQNEWILKHTHHLVISNRGVHIGQNDCTLFTKSVAFICQKGAMLKRKEFLEGLPGAFPSLILDINFVMSFTNVHKNTRI